jgi:RNA polymerase sigma-70 factor, ECF subfamily
MAIAPLTATPTTPQDPPSSPDNLDHVPAIHDPIGLVFDSEANLRTAAAAGDRTAFAALYANYRETVYRFLLRRCHGDRHLAEDLTQDTFARAIRGLDRYRETGRPFGAWLLAIANNLLIDYWRSSWHRRHLLWSDFTGETEVPLAEKDDCGGDPAIDVAESEQRRHLASIMEQAVGRLSVLQQKVVSLRYTKGLSVAETADALGLEAGAVKAATYRARQALAVDPTVEELR